MQQRVVARAVSCTNTLGRYFSRIASQMAANRLSTENSPYLRQHASNPVHWFPWGEEAFSKAKTTNRLIFLSIGYSTCHWCHVMAHESFENEEIAKILNENFVSIKVDREERPDVDKVYMSFVQAISGLGGWPLSVFLTPDLKPITGGTYFPPHDMNGRPGFRSILTMITEKWRTEGEEMAASADIFVCSMRRSMKPERGKLPPVEEVERICYNHLNDSFDEQYKGFGSAPKFPKCVDLEFLLCFYCIHANSEAGKNALRMVGETLKALDRGGIHDHVGKGFHRYSVDSKWHVPHFEKMLYDQAQLLAVYAIYHTITGEFGEVIEDIIEYVDTMLTHKSGGFYSAEDADSLPSFGSVKKREGAYYTWTENEIDAILKKPIADMHGLTYADVFKMYYNVQPNGNVPAYADPHDELKAQNVLIMKESDDMLAAKCALDVKKLQNVISEAKVALLEAQQKRPKPHLDNKILTSWNGLMISGLAKAAITMKNADFLRRAQRTADFIRKFLTTSTGLLHVAYVGADSEIDKIDSQINAYADDYAYLIQGLLDLYEASFDEQQIKWACELQEQMDKLFWDTTYNSGYHQTVEDPHIIVRIMDDQDGAEPSVNSVASLNLVRLYGITNEKAYSDRAEKIFESAAQRLNRYPFILAKMITAFQRLRRPPKQIVVVGSRSSDTTKQMLSVISEHFDCCRTLISLDPEKDLWLQNLNDHLKQIASSTDKSTVYMCENFACMAPITSLDELMDKFTTKK